MGFNILKMFSYRMGKDGCRIAGWIRIAFATLAIVDRLLLHLDLDLFLSPTTGLLPISQEKEGLFGILSLLRFATRGGEGVGDAYSYLWSVHYFGLLNSVLLLLGVAPRLNAFALFIITCSFHNANWMIVDGDATGHGPMARLYNFHLLFLPLHHITIYDGFGFGRKGTKNDNDTWPMWTAWLWQWETILVLLGAWVGKVADGTHWIDGTAMYYVLHCTDECIGFFNPDILFNRALPSKILTWSALVIEGISPLTIWVRGLPRKVTLVLLTMLFFGMDISMTMHTFEWYSVLGWCLFLIERDDDVKQCSRIPFWRIILDGSVFFFILGLAFNLAFPLELILTMTPTRFSEKVDPFLQWNQGMTDFYAYPIASVLGIYQDVWSLYSGEYDGATSKLSVDAFLTNGTIMTWSSPNWQDLGRWEHKRLYNHMAYYKHLPDCSFNEDDECEEWNKLIDMLMETFYNDVKDNVVKLELWHDVEYPPEYPENIGWWDSLKQPLIRESETKLETYTWHAREIVPPAHNNDVGGVPQFELHNGVTVPLVGLGCASGVREEHVVSAIDVGYRFFDTAQSYNWGYHEDEVGDAIEAYAGDDVFVQTKIHPEDLGYDATRLAVHVSLKRLKTDHIDSVLIHKSRCWEGACTKESEGTWQESWKALEEFVDAGVVGAIGICDVDDRLLDELLQQRIKPHIIQNWMDPFHQYKKIRERSKAEGILFQAYSSLGSQWVHHRGHSTNPVLTNPTLKSIANKYGVSVAQVIINWATRHGVSVLPASTNAKRQRQNLNSFGFQLSDEEILSIDSLDDKAPKPAEKNPNEVSVVFENHGDGSIDSFWISHEKEEVPVGSIGPGGGELTQSSFHGHKFVFRDGDGVMKGEHVVHRDHGQQQRHVVHGEL